jgi:hypothetical protein
MKTPLYNLKYTRHKQCCWTNSHSTTTHFNTQIQQKKPRSGRKLAANVSYCFEWGTITLNGAPSGLWNLIESLPIGLHSCMPSNAAYVILRHARTLINIESERILSIFDSQTLRMFQHKKDSEKSERIDSLIPVSGIRTRVENKTHMLLSVFE